MTQRYKKLNDPTQTRTLTPLTYFSVITNLHISLSLPYSFMLVTSDDSPTPTDVFSHHGESQNVCTYFPKCLYSLSVTFFFSELTVPVLGGSTVSLGNHAPVF